MFKIITQKTYYTAYADDTTSFFLKDKNSVLEIIFYKFSLVSAQKTNTRKCEIAVIAILKELNVALCDMKGLNLMKETMTILGAHFSYNNKLENEMNFQSHIIKFENVRRLLLMRNLTIEGKVLVFKSLAISKIAHLSLITTVPHEITNQLNIIQRSFIWNGKIQK